MPRAQLKSTHTTERKLSLDLNKRKSENDLVRRKLRSNEKLLASPLHTSSSSSSSFSDADHETEEKIKLLLMQSKNRLENTKIFKLRQHLLKPEDHVRYDNFLNNLLDDTINSKHSTSTTTTDERSAANYKHIHNKFKACGRLYLVFAIFIVALAYIYFS